ncbi:MAG: molybdopterin molybdenumtransferase MoeA, partial [Comamonadaceae bacterium]
MKVAELVGDDLPVERVHEFIAQIVASLALAEEPDTEHVPLHEALGRVLAQDIVSPISVPPHDNSAMDGYAFDGALLEAGAPPDVSLTLRVVGTALAGRSWRGALA